MTNAANSIPPENASAAVDWAAKGTGMGFADPEISARHAALFKVAGERRAEAVELLKRAGEQPILDAEYVHDLRVGLRRLSEVAGLLTVLIDKASGRAVEESLKTLRRSAGELRDLDVTAEHLNKWRMPGPVKTVARQVVEMQAMRRPELEKSLRTAGTSASMSGALVVLARVLEEQQKPECIHAAVAKLDRELERVVSQRRKKLKRSFGKAAQKQRATDLHEARIAAKKLRYVVELQKEMNEKGKKSDLKFLKTIQQLLGDHHDVHVIEETLGKEIAAKRAGVPKGVGPAWRKWRREVERAQGKRAADFFMRTYAWINQASR